MNKLIEKTKFSDQVSKYIRDMIITGDLKSGDRIVETKVAKILGVSQAPVREALRELEVMGMVEIKPYSGCFVLPMDEKKLLQVYSLRSMLECFAAEQGVELITGEEIETMKTAIEEMLKAATEGNSIALVEYDVLFHSMLIKSARNIMLEKMWRLVGAPQWSSVTISSYANLNYFAHSHNELLGFIEQRNVKGVVEELKKHFNKAASFVLDSLNEKKKS